MAHTIEKEWTTKHGLKAVVLVCEMDGRKTHRCGYVEVKENHPLYKVDYNDPCPALKKAWIAAKEGPIGKRSPVNVLFAIGMDDEAPRPDCVFNVHGGLTFSGAGSDGYPTESDGWWFGFDCHHHGDGEIEPHPNPIFSSCFEGPARNLDYVERECENLACQLSVVDIKDFKVKSWRYCYE
jgi:hypothetical protein